MNAKKTAFGITGAAAVALLSMGAVAPAMADDNTSSSSNDTTSSVTRVLNDLAVHDFGNVDALKDIGNLTNSSPVVVAPQIGDIGSGNAVGSGNDVAAPLLSGNETAVGSGNDTSVGTSVSDLVDNSVGASVSDLVDGSVGDITGSVSDIVGDATSSVDLGAILGD